MGGNKGERREGGHIQRPKARVALQIGILLSLVGGERQEGFMICTVMEA
jgi:hypothetical protein